MAECQWESGTKYGRLITTGKSYSGEKSKRFVEVICICKKIKWMRFDSVKSSPNASCGCYNSERVKTNPIHITHGLSKHPLWDVYRSIKDRCYRPSSNRHKNYGAKNVILCKEWYDSYEAFYNWAIDKWKPGLQLDKDILYKAKFGSDTGMIYSPEFCCFVTPKENSRNRTTSRFLEYNGQKRTTAEWSDILGISQQTLSIRLNKYKWTVEKTLSTPLKILKKRLSL